MNKRKHGGARPGAGRPPTNPEEHHIIVSISLPPWQHELLQRQEEGISKTIQRLIDENIDDLMQAE